jgi:hypothetical protein
MFFTVFLDLESPLVKHPDKEWNVGDQESDRQLH